jgi:hypothetical protein
MGRYLDNQTVKTYLNLGKTIEVFLGRISDNREIISFLEFKKTNTNNIEVTYIEVYDEGNLEFLDLYSFSFVDPDMNFEKFNFENIDSAIEFIRDKFKLNEIKFVNAGIIQDEYADLLKSEGRS